ncbi:4-diphosphocytidyl-2-C-methyl-D-erythritol kinase [Kitasatospora sp. NE20-6]|uniref:4-(cytidine 5'-diphospho)-2-C-methyl-D-erythritol kinase n=1 Tax=Kitasatospora sp. NE20-6 TaxID=2859066 RepID=UPI0034DC1D25
MNDASGPAALQAGPAVRVRAPGKVNLLLSVGPRRPDGYHPLTTVFLAVDLYDDIEVRPNPLLRVTVHGHGADEVPLDGGNLAARAARLLAAHAGFDTSVDIRIRKRIPVAGGMAGGSADAAATLVACNELWSLGLTGPELHDLATRLGSDVAFPLLGGAAVGTGRGELLVPLPGPDGTQFHWVFALSPRGLGTVAVFSEHDRLHIGGEARSEREVLTDLDRLKDALLGCDVHALAAVAERGNDLQRAALSLRPDLRGTLRAGREAGALAALVSGSGPTCAFLAESAEAAAELAEILSASGTCRQALVATGPAAGCTALR